MRIIRNSFLLVCPVIRCPVKAKQVTNRRATQRGGTIHLDSLASFQQTLKQTQDRMVAQIAQKIDNFFEEAQYPWATSQAPPAHLADDASPYLQDMVDYVSTVMISVLIQLPDFAKDYVYRGALAHIAKILQVRCRPRALSSMIYPAFFFAFC